MILSYDVQSKIKSVNFYIEGVRANTLEINLTWPDSTKIVNLSALILHFGSMRKTKKHDMSQKRTSQAKLGPSNGRVIMRLYGTLT